MAEKEQESSSDAKRLNQTEIGALGIKAQGGRIQEEPNISFRFPNFIKIVQEMVISPPVAVGLEAQNTLMNRAQLKVVPLKNETAAEKKQRQYLESIFNDLDTSWQSVLQSITTFKEFGFALVEPVYRRRLKRKGSKYNDGLVGLKKLAFRPQNTIKKWNFSPDGREVVSVSQDVSSTPDPQYFRDKLKDSFLEIPMDRLIHFVCGGGTNPEGHSILKPIYLHYKMLTVLTDNMCIGVSKDTTGIPIVGIPAKFMDPNASVENKLVYETFCKIADGLADGTQKSAVIPREFSLESKQSMFSVDILENKSGKAYDIPVMIKLLQQNILSVLGANSLQMSSDQGGSLSLSDSNTNMLALTVAYRLAEIANTLSMQLVPRLWKLNGWNTERMPELRFADISNVSLEEFSKYIQRVMSVGGLEMDREVFNRIRNVGGFELKPEDEEIDMENLSTTLAGKSSSAGEGMAVGVTGDGTSTKPTKTDNSARNADNKA